MHYIKLYVNSINSKLASIYNEVNYYDFIILEIFSLFYNDIYVFIHSNKNIFIKDISRDIINYIITKNKGENAESNSKKLIDEILSKYPEDKNILLILLSELFPAVNELYKDKITIVPENESYDSKKLYKEKCICDSDHFDKYFTLSVHPHKLTTEYIDNFINKINSLEVNKISEFIKVEFDNSSIVKSDNTYDLTNLLIDICIGNVERKINEDVLIEISMFLLKSDKLLNLSYSNMKYIVTNLTNIKNTSIRKEKFKQLLSKNINFGNVSMIIYQLLNEIEFKPIDLDIDKLIDNHVKFLSRYFIEGNRNIFNDIVDENIRNEVIHDWVSSWGKITYDTKKNLKIHNYIISIVKNDYKHFISFCQIFTREHIVNSIEEGLHVNESKINAYNYKILKEISDKFICLKVPNIELDEEFILKDINNALSEYVKIKKTTDKKSKNKLLS